jgi:hypothetical protein
MALPISALSAHIVAAGAAPKLEESFLNRKALNWKAKNSGQAAQLAQLQNPFSFYWIPHVWYWG